MYERIVILPYEQGSKSVEDLQIKLTEFGVNVVVPSQRPTSKFRLKETDMVINWGNSRPYMHKGIPADYLGVPIINDFYHVKTACNKLTFFDKMSDSLNAPRIPDYTDSQDVALAWLNAGFAVCARYELNGHSADGLVIFDPEGDHDHEEAPLYTQYIPKRHEYRIHYAFGAVITSQRKALRADTPFPDWRIRNLDNGFVYIQGGLIIPEDVYAQAKRAMDASGLDFGAVDVIWNEKQKKAYVLEINTAPGLAGQTITNYAGAFLNHMELMNNPADELPDWFNDEPVEE